MSIDQLYEREWLDFTFQRAMQDKEERVLRDERRRAGMMRGLKLAGIGILLGVLIGLLTGCSYQHERTWLVPTSPAVTWADQSAATALVESGLWTGSTTATGLGESGTLTAAFMIGEGGTVDAQLTWTSNTTSLSYGGTVTGTFANLVISATSPTACTYTAQGTLSDDKNTFSGTYAGAGPGVCPQKTGIFELHRPFTPPPPQEPSCPASYAYSGANPFELGNSSDATELSYVRDNVYSGLIALEKVNEPGGTSWTADESFAVVLVKAATEYYLYTNVHVGDVVESHSFNKKGVQQAISHVSRFVCVE